MARYRLKRKTYGVVGDAAKNTIGGVMSGAGTALDNKVAGFAGGLAGASHLGSTLGGIIGGPLGGLVGMGLGYVAGSALTRGVGKGLKNAGQDLQMSV